MLDRAFARPADALGVFLGHQSAGDRLDELVLVLPLVGRAIEGDPHVQEQVRVVEPSLPRLERRLDVDVVRGEAALVVDPGSFEALARLLGLFAPAGRVPELIPLLTRAVARMPDSARHQALLGEARLAAKDYRASESSFTRALQLAPDGDAVRISLARVHVMQQQPEKALAVLAAAKPSVDRSVLLGAIYSASGDWNTAASHLQSALDGGRVTPDVLNGLGYSRLKLGQRQQAAELFSRSLAMKPGQPEIRKLLGEIRQEDPQALR